MRLCLLEKESQKQKEHQNEANTVNSFLVNTLKIRM